MKPSTFISASELALLTNKLLAFNVVKGAYWGASHLDSSQGLVRGNAGMYEYRITNGIASIAPEYDGITEYQPLIVALT